MKSFKVPLFVLLILLLAILACGGGGGEPVADEPPAPPPEEPEAAEPTPPEPEPVEPAEEPPGRGDASDELPPEVKIGLGGNGLICEWPPSDDELPAMEVQALYYASWICLWGFPAGEEVTLELYDPAGQAVGSRGYVVEEHSSGLGRVFADICLVSRPAGEWLAVAQSPSMGFEQSFQAGATEWPMIGVLLGAPADVFSNCVAGWLDFPVGTEATIFGYGFPQSQDLALGIYQLSDSEAGAEGQAALLDGLWVTTDDQGNFEMLLNIDSSYPAGRYFAIVVLDDQYMPWPGVWDSRGATGQFWVIE